MELEGVTVPAPEGGPADTWSQGSQLRAGSGRAQARLAHVLLLSSHLRYTLDAGLRAFRGPKPLQGLGKSQYFHDAPEASLCPGLAFELMTQR